MIRVIRVSRGCREEARGSEDGRMVRAGFLSEGIGRDGGKARSVDAALFREGR